jgi:hypothetical protein
MPVGLGSKRLRARTEVNSARVCLWARVQRIRWLPESLEKVRVRKLLIGRKKSSYVNRRGEDLLMRADRGWHSSWERPAFFATFLGTIKECFKGSLLGSKHVRDYWSLIAKTLMDLWGLLEWGSAVVLRLFATRGGVLFMSRVLTLNS